MMQEIKEVFVFFNYKPTQWGFDKSLNFFSTERQEIRRTFEMLSWEANRKDQSKAIDYLAENLQPWEYIYLVMPDKYTMVDNNGIISLYKHWSSKSLWENAAKTIIKIGWPRVDSIIVPLFMWLLDSNWPGSAIIYDFLLSLPHSALKGKMNEVLDNANCYSVVDYEDLKELMNALWEDAQEDDAGYGTGLRESQ